jgi:TFIIF-interacting CTD phosphatase-like protein
MQNTVHVHHLRNLAYPLGHQSSPPPTLSPWTDEKVYKAMTELVRYRDRRQAFRMIICSQRARLAHGKVHQVRPLFIYFVYRNRQG